MAKHAGTFQFVLDAVAAEHGLNAYLDRSSTGLTPQRRLP